MSAAPATTAGSQVMSETVTNASLAATGSNSAWLVGLAALFLLGGVTLLGVSRRRTG
jgi:LPXTG-motif cell wall-anchored protein